MAFLLRMPPGISYPGQRTKIKSHLPLMHKSLQRPSAPCAHPPGRTWIFPGPETLWDKINNPGHDHSDLRFPQSQAPPSPFGAPGAALPSLSGDPPESLAHTSHSAHLWTPSKQCQRLTRCGRSWWSLQLPSALHAWPLSHLPRLPSTCHCAEMGRALSPALCLPAC